MAITRASLVGGPARCLLDGEPFFTKESFGVTPEMQLFPVAPQGYSQRDERVSDVLIPIQLTPDGRVSNALLAKFYPYANVMKGASACGASDRAFVAHGSDGALLTVKAVAVQKMPEITFSSVKTLFGQLGLLSVLANNMDPDDADSHMTYAASGGSYVDATFGLDAIPTQQYFGTWGNVSGFSSMQTRDGFKFTAEVDFEPSPVDGLGVVDYKVKEVRAMISCIPVGPTAAQLLTNYKIQGAGARIGRSMNADAKEFTLVGADGITYLTIPKASMQKAGWKFGENVLRNDEVAWVATLNQTDGVQGDLFTLNSEAED